ncbi:valine--tRNA ligase [Mycoplasma sp. Mirounga ES2805-ORL]|uniref:valine--tRNA ligase n=1 Tax=Mycoplasma sp. Mirounga ES2805-ORL TaxID=754514 RepID=UPI00197C6EC0|nr:valine--tRNA ligase [Mycoplasma sp. Mirounga ES2805-ORL]QSF13798.1 valine--tRNA ligase [Mycoplasma sp. Mirounga ES2805-ORL]
MKLEKIYRPGDFEKNISEKWRSKKYFSKHDKSKPPFTILLPPPNVTGKLHIGHALDTAIQDTIIRYKKLSGFDVFYIAGMDHAGIATQSKVEKIIFEKEGLTRHDLGREKFLEKLWDWKYEYADHFRKQWSSLGLALDYTNERFTLDEQSNKAVNKAFINLYNKKLIYRGARAINWDPILKTAISNIEVINKPTEQIMYYIKYPIYKSNEYITIATVRPETMLSDVAVIYNPKDKRYNQNKNTMIKHPLTNELIPMIEDSYADMNFGTGLMKLSAHAEADIEIIKKHNLKIVETIDDAGRINCENSQFHGLTRDEARISITNYLKANNLIIKEEKTISNVGYSERSGAVTEVLVKPQWFVKMDTLAKKILNDLKTKEGIKFYPPRFKENLKKWMSNIRDWNISRQLWWGHRIPAWYDKNDNLKVQVDSPGEGWTQDEDVLDTWFSSGLAPFSFLGWPNKSSKLKRYYPNSLLVTGFDIIFFWVARMYLFGLELTNSKPFDKVLIHGLVRAADGQKMSKSLNNGVDPIDIIDKYGADAMRWFLITNTTPGMDLRYSEEKIESAWGLCNKLWNISRYIQSVPNDNNKLSDFDKWIDQKLNSLKLKIDKWFKKYEFTLIGSEISKFIYNDFSSWYVEFLKVKPNKKAALNALKKLLLIIHPFLPFVTDEIYKNLFNKELLLNEYSNEFKRINSSSKNRVVDNIINITRKIREYRESNNISKKETIYFDINIQKEDWLVDSIKKLANAEIRANSDYLIVCEKINIYIKEDENLKKIRIEKIQNEIKRLESEVARSRNILNNKNFMNKAPQNKIDEEKQKLNKYETELAKYKEELTCKY